LAWTLKLRATLMECSTVPVTSQQLLYQHVELVTTVSSQAGLRSLAERHFEEAAPQLSHHPFLQLATMESNADL
jgi:hypothetical protein